MSSTQSVNDCFFDNSELVKSYLKSFKLDKIENDQKIIEELNIFIQQNPENQDAYMLRGMVFTKINQCQNACDDFTKAIHLDSKNQLLYLQRGHILKLLKKFKDAQQDYSTAIKIQPEVANSYYYKGLLLKEMGLLEDALEDFNQAINLDPNDSKFYVAKGDLLFEINKIDQSLDCYNKAIEISQQNKVAYKQRGTITLQKGNLFYYMEQYENALNDYSKALKLDPNYIAAQYNKGLIFEQLNRLPEALEAYNQTIQIDAKYVNAYIGLGIVYKNMKQIPNAIDYYTKALQLDPTSVFGYNARGNIYSELNQLIDALNDYSQALQLDPNYVNAYNGRGNVYKNLNRQSEALDDYTTAIQLDPKYTNAYNGRGCVLSDMQRLSEALNDLQKAVELSPDNPLFLVNLGKLQIATQQYDQAEFSLAKAQNIFNQSDEQQIMIKFNLSQENVNHITKSLELLSEIRTNFKQLNLMIYKLDHQSNQIIDEKNSIQTHRDNIQTKLLKNFGDLSSEQIRSYQNINELLFQLIIRLQTQIDDIQNKQNQMQNQITDQEQDINNLKQNDVIYITETIKKLKKPENQNNYLFYLSFCSRILTHIEACLLIETNFLQTKNDAGLETQTENLIDNINNVAQKVSPFLGGIPIVGPAIESIFELLDYGLEYYKEQKFQAKIKKIVSVMKSKSATQSEREREIQIASFQIIEQIKEEDLSFEKSEYFKSVQKIVDVEIKSIPQANNPFWMLGIENSIIVLKYIEQQSEQIVTEQNELRDVIVQSLKQKKVQKSNQSTQSLPKTLQVRSSSVCCQIF